MAKIVSTPEGALRNISRFQDQLASSSVLQDRLAYARAWYADRDDNGYWRFGPSKFIGYQNMTAEAYSNGCGLDGRVTERQLGNWFVEVPKSDPLYGELEEGLRGVLDEYGKVPSSLLRINVTREFYEKHVAHGSAPLDRAVADLLIVVALRLPKEERERVRAAL